MSSIVTHINALQELHCNSVHHTSIRGYANILKAKTGSNRRHLVSDLLEVLAQLDNRVVSVGCLDSVGVVGDEEGLGGLEGNDAFLALNFCQCVFLGQGLKKRTFLALSESSLDSMVMYFTPLTLTPFAMTALVSLLSLKDWAMALISAAVS
jgi:hypothetical protein